MNIRYADMSDLAAVTAVEAACFPPAEAATEQDFAQRLRYYSGHFWLMFDGGTLIAFVDGFVTDEPDLTDDMYENAALHNENGAWQMIFGVNTLPEYRQHGYAGELLRRAIDDARKQGRKGLVLTCKERLIHYYARFGFVDEGVSEKSTHGNVVWHQMRLTYCRAARIRICHCKPGAVRPLARETYAGRRRTACPPDPWAPRHPQLRGRVPDGLCAVRNAGGVILRRYVLRPAAGAAGGERQSLSPPAFFGCPVDFFGKYGIVS